MDPGDTREPVEKEVRLLVPVEKNQAHPKRVSYGVVLEPDVEDLQGDVMSAEDIEQSAYDWMERSQSGGHMHSSLVEGATVVESYIAPSDIPIETAAGPETIRKGSWVLAMRWPEEIWSSIEKGDLTGYSVGGTGVRLALEAIDKHAHHDQSTHGNWAHGGAKSPRLQAWERYLTAPTPEERRAAGDEYVRLADEDDARGGYTGLKPDSYVTFHDGVKARIVSIHEDGAIEVESPNLPGDRSMLLLRGQIDSEGNVDLAPKTHPGPYERTSAYGGMDPATRGAAAEGGGTPADQGIAAAQNESFPVYTEQIDSQGRIRQVRVDVPKEEAEWKAGYGQDASQGWEAEAGYPTFTRGQKVRTRTGQIQTIHSQRGAQVFVEEEGNSWYHPNKLVPVYWSNELGWVTIPDREDEVKKDGDHDQPVHESLAEIVRDAFAEEIAKHGSGDQKPHGNWADGRHEEGGAATIREGAKVEFASGDTGTIEEIEWGSLGWPTTYRVKLATRVSTFPASSAARYAQGAASRSTAPATRRRTGTGRAPPPRRASPTPPSTASTCATNPR
jgi:hypothetical protein